MKQILEHLSFFYYEKTSRLELAFLSTLLFFFSCSENLFLILVNYYREVKAQLPQNIRMRVLALIFTYFKMCYEMPTTLILHTPENT